MGQPVSSEVRRQVVELARAGTKVKQLAAAFGVSQASVDNWLKQDRIDRGEAEGASMSQQLELAAAKRRIRQLETELAIARKVNEVFLNEGIATKAIPHPRKATLVRTPAVVGDRTLVRCQNPAVNFRTFTTADPPRLLVLQAHR